LWPGWIFGRKVDNSDRQYANFRNNLPILFAVLLLHFVLRRAFNVVFIRVSPTPPSNSSYLPSHNLTRRKLFDIFFALIFLTALHSLSVLKIVFIIVVNFLISFFHPSSDYVPILTWLFNIGVLFANEYYSGYRFQVILPWLTAGEGAGVGYAMDNFMGGGILRRWHISFNITVLRLISYNMDHYWAAVRKKEGNDIDGTVIEVGRLTPRYSSASFENPDLERSIEGVIRRGGSLDSQEEQLMEQPKKMRSYPANLNEKDRVDMPAKMQDYSLLNYMAYVLYTPLYLAGPIITFNDFIHQVDCLRSFST
jgi:D-alanyl-lipoteichoic acid acyltransferase DltB (MBOAT superfamily)